MGWSPREFLLSSLASGAASGVHSALQGWDAVALDEALLGWVAAPPSARVALAALSLLAERSSPRLEEAATLALASPLATLRKRALAQPAAIEPQALVALAWCEPSHAVRIALALRDSPLPPEAVRAAGCDPHWRVRQALLRRFAGADQGWLEWLGGDTRSRGLVSLLTGGPAPAQAEPERVEFWDDDPAVLGDRIGAVDVRPADAIGLLSHADRRVRRAATRALVARGDAADIGRAFALDPRGNGVAAELAALVERLDEDRRGQGAELAWASAETPGARAFACTHLNELPGDWLDGPAWMRSVVEARRAPATQRDRPERIPRRESVEVAAAVETPRATPGDDGSVGAGERRALGTLAVSPLGLSGHHGLDEAGFARGLEAGVNLFFWEPSYVAQTRFFRGLAPSVRSRVVAVAGSFEARAAAVKADLERALRLTSLGRIDLFLLFWVRSWGRVGDDVAAMLEQQKAAGAIGEWGLSTHRRALAREAIERGIDPVMVRHNLAHRGAETELFDLAAERAAGLITFSNLLYGRLFEPSGEGAPPSARECYAYSLAQPAVTATLSSPETHAQLEENLAALEHRLSPERVNELRRHGDAVYRRELRYRRLVRER